MQLDFLVCVLIHILGELLVQIAALPCCPATIVTSYLLFVYLSVLDVGK